MPYINRTLRQDLEPELTALIWMLRGRSEGELNYAISRIIVEWAESPQPSYSQYCRARGVLQDVADELYRRRVAPYEDTKIKENGDIYGC